MRNTFYNKKVTAIANGKRIEGIAINRILNANKEIIILEYQYLNKPLLIRHSNKVAVPINEVSEVSEFCLKETL